MIGLFLAQGFEEIEALTTVDILRRAGLNVVTIGVGGRQIVGTHNIAVTADIDDASVPSCPDWQAVVLPGGMPGTTHLDASPAVARALKQANDQQALLCAICAAPSVLGHQGYLQGRRAVCYPGFERELIGAVPTDASVVTDGRIITAEGAGVAVDFALEIVAQLLSADKAAQIREQIRCR